LTVIVASLGSTLMTPVYAASSIVRIAENQETINRFERDYSERLVNTNVHVLKSRPFLEEVIRRLDLNLTPRDLAQMINTEALANTELIKITVQSISAEQATQIANTLGTVLIEQRQTIHSGATKSPSEILREQLTIVEESLRADRALLQSLLNRNTSADQAGIMQDLNTRIQTQEQTYNSLLRQLSGLLNQQQLTIQPGQTANAPDIPAEILREQLDTVEASLRDDRALLQSLLSSPIPRPGQAGIIQDLSIRIQTQEQAYNYLLAELGLLLNQQRQTTQPGQTRSTTEIAADILREQLATVGDNLREDRALLQSLVNRSVDPDQARIIEDLNARIQTQEQTYGFLLREYEAASTREAIRANSISIVAPATIPEAPSQPRTKLNILLGGLVGLVGGVGLAFLFENLDSTLHSVDDLEAVATVPLMGAIPKFTVPRGLHHHAILASSNGASPAGEAFRILRSNILPLVASSPPVKTLLIVSAEPGSGKSTVLANLATVTAQAGRQVIVVDTDLRHPSLHLIFGLPNEVGLSHVILGLSPVDVVLQNTRIPGLRALTSGPLLSKPAEQLESSKRMPALIEELANQADVVFFDSAPVLAVADAAVLAPVVDGVLLVAAQDQATDKHLQWTLRQLEKVGANVLGIVFNKSKASGIDFYYYGDTTASVKP
jgi:capsular exopolysaccharide synthesis family protein